MHINRPSVAEPGSPDGDIYTQALGVENMLSVFAGVVLCRPLSPSPRGAFGDADADAVSERRIASSRVRAGAKRGPPLDADGFRRAAPQRQALE